jgi:hypothetical protein
VSGDVVVASFRAYKAGFNAGAGLEFRLGDSHPEAFAEDWPKVDLLVDWLIEKDKARKSDGELGCNACRSIDAHKFNAGQLASMKKTCQRHCFSTPNHNLAYCYYDARVMKFVWTNLVKNRMNGGARSFED